MQRGDDTDDIHTERWCAGLRLEHERPLEPNERAILERNVAAVTTGIRHALLGAAAGVAIPLLTVLLAPKPQPSWVAGTVTLALFLVMIVAPAMLLLRTRDLWRVRRRFERDRDGGVMLCFAGIIGFHEVLDEEQKRLLDAGLLRPEPGSEQRLDVLPVTGAALQPRPTGAVRFVPVRVIEVAAGPAYALRVAVPRHVAWIDGATDAEIARRTLNDSERAEIDHHARRLRRPGGWTMLWLAWASCWVLAATFRPEVTLEYARERWLLVAIQVVLMSIMLVHYLRALRLARLLERDTDTGWALTLERAGEDAEEEAAAVEATEGRSIEFLPHSRAVWNEQGKPARWRNFGRRAA